MLAQNQRAPERRKGGGLQYDSDTLVARSTTAEQVQWAER
jgi:hypothetical protein